MMGTAPGVGMQEMERGDGKCSRKLQLKKLGFKINWIVGKYTYTSRY